MDPGQTLPLGPGDQPSGQGVGWIGPYRVDGELARGGMGVVYRAFHTQLGRPVAIKVQRAGASSTETERFRIEAQAAARLRHPNIAGIHEVGLLPDGNPFLVMDLIEGGSLKQRLEAEGPLPLTDAAQLIATLARAVAFAHGHNILHRDIKPANVLLNQEGAPVLTDFGLAKHVGAASGVTVTGQIMGTPSYMPPEQADGNTDQIDRRSDVYSLGATLYALLTGDPPFTGDSAIQVISSVLGKPPTPPRKVRPEIDRDLDTICLHCLEKEPEQRYPSALALAEDLERYLAGEGIAARPVGALERLWRRTRRRPALVAAFGGLLLLLFSVLGAGLFVTRRALLDAVRERGEKERQAAKAAAEARRAEEQTAKADVVAILARAQAQLERGYGLLGRRRYRLAAETFAEAADRVRRADNTRARALFEVASRGAAEAARGHGVRVIADDVAVARFLPNDEHQRIVIVGRADLRLVSLDSAGKPRIERRVAAALLPVRDGVIDRGGRTLALAHQVDKVTPTQLALRAKGIVTLWDLPELTRRAGLQVAAPGEPHPMVDAMDIRPDGKEVMFALRNDGMLFLADAATGRIHRTIPSTARPHARYRAPSLACAYSTDGNLFLVGYRDGTFSVWDRQGRHRTWRNLRGDGPRLLRWLDPGSFGHGQAGFLVAGEELGRVRVFRPGGAPRILLDGREGAATGGDLLRGGQDQPDLLAVGTADGTLRVWVAPGGAEVARFRLGGGKRVHCSLSPQRSSVLITSGGQAKLLDMSKVQTLRGQGPVAVDARGHRVARLREVPGPPATYQVDVWDLKSRRRIANVNVAGPQERVRSLALSPDGRRLIVGVMPWHVSGGDGFDPARKDYDRDAGSLVEIDLETRRRTRRAVHQPYALSIHGGRVFVGARRELGGGARPRGRVTVIDSLGESRHGSWHVMSVRCFAHASDGSYATGADDGTVAVWGSKGDLRQVLDLRLEASISTTRIPPLPGEDQPLAAGPDADLISRIGVRFMRATQRPPKLEPHMAARVIRDTWGVRGLAFSPDGRLLATGTGDARLRIWDLASGTLKTVLEVDHSVVACGFLSGGRLALATRGGVVQVWELALDAAQQRDAADARPLGGHVLRKIETGSQITHAALGGDTLLAACEDSTVWAWDLSVPPLAGFRSDPRKAVEVRLGGD